MHILVMAAGKLVLTLLGKQKANIKKMCRNDHAEKVEAL